VNAQKDVNLSLSKGEKLLVYPNPATSQLTISSKQLAKGEKVEIYNALGLLMLEVRGKKLDLSIPQGDIKVEIYNVMGMKMLEVRGKKLDPSIPQGDSSLEIDISALAKGIYLVKVGNETAKLVVE
jgi:hypothetical protein